MDKIVVGSDGSPEAAAAVRWAAEDAHRRRAKLLVVESWREPESATGPWLASEADIASRKAEVKAELETATEKLRAEHPDVLIAESADAVLAVVGARGLGGFVKLLLGSVARRVSTSGADLGPHRRGTPRSTTARGHGLEEQAEVVNDLVPRALIDRAEFAALLVVGPGDSSLRHRVDLGSVTAQLVQHEPANLAIVRSAIPYVVRNASWI